MTFTLHGYAAPYGRRVMRWQGENCSYEQIAPGAFNQFLAGPLPNIRFLLGSHDDAAPIVASTGAGTAGLFADSTGLGFWARIDPAYEHVVRQHVTDRHCPANQCSVNMGIIAGRSDRWCGKSCETITEATLSDHIAIGVPHGVYGEETGCWPAGSVDDAPWHIRRMAAQWDDGAAKWNRRPPQRAAQEQRPSAAAMRAANRRPLPPMVMRNLIAYAAIGKPTILGIRQAGLMRSVKARP